MHRSRSSGSPRDAAPGRLAAALGRAVRGCSRRGIAALLSAGVLGAGGAGAQVRPLPSDVSVRARPELAGTLLAAIARADTVPGPRAWVYAVSTDPVGGVTVAAVISSCVPKLSYTVRVPPPSSPTVLPPPVHTNRFPIR